MNDKQLSDMADHLLSREAEPLEGPEGEAMKSALRHLKDAVGFLDLIGRGKTAQSANAIEDMIEDLSKLLKDE